MNEDTLQIVSSLKILWVAIYSFLYGRGGMNNKALRRVFGSLLLSLGIIGFSLWQRTFSYYYMLLPLLYFGCSSIGYGHDDVWMKIWKRTYCGLAYACASLPIVIVNQAWVLFALHTFICVAVSVTLGVVNPVEAREEETLIAVSIGLMPLFMI